MRENDAAVDKGRSCAYILVCNVRLAVDVIGLGFRVSSSTSTGLALSIYSLRKCEIE